MKFKNKQALVNARLSYQSQVREILEQEYPNLVFLLSPEDTLSVWIRDKKCSSGAGVQLDEEHSKLSNFDGDYFDFLNKQVALAVEQPDKYFYCTECGRVLENKDYAANVFAGYYCKECAEKPEIAKIISMSKERGFYD